MSTPKEAYEELITRLKEISLLGSTNSILGWDERTLLPPKGTDLRAMQSSLLSRMTHEMFIDKRVGDLLSTIESSPLVKDPESDVAANVRETRRSYDRAVKLPAKLVEEITSVSVHAQTAWVEARKNSDFKTFAPWLGKTLDLQRQVANCIGYASGNPYDALLDEYEPGETAANLDRVFESLRGPLVDLVGRIAGSSKKAPIEILERKYPAAGQEKLAREAAAKVGFDFEAGRLDTSVHPFCSGIGPGDTRMTTRYDENYFGDAFFGVLHETGHGLYDQGVLEENFGTPMGGFVSLGIHESQSRMWENLVARSRSFWNFFMPRAREIFADTLKDVSDDDWYFAINDVRPSFIRTESDEATYNLHILLRFEIEQAMLKGDIKVDDIPAAWNEKMKKYLGLTPPDDAKGCLQDVHWSGGAIGYFPTYTLGNLYAAQFFEQARKDLGDLDAMFAKGDFAPLLGWLQKNIHVHGKKFTAPQLAKKITGKNLSAQPLLDHLNRKAKDLYNV